MDTQVTIEDMDSFVDALRYSQTLVNTANAGADLAFDFLRSYDYYGSVRMAVASGTKVEAEAITLSGYNATSFFSYDEHEMIGYFYPLGSSIFGIVNVGPIGEAGDTSFLTKELIDGLSVIKEGSIGANYLTYDTSLSFDSSVDDDNTIFPIGIYDQLFYKIGDTINIDGADWDVRLSLTNGVIVKAKDTSLFEMNNVEIDGGISSENITFSSHLETKEEILKNVIREDGILATNAVVPEDVGINTNIFTLRKLAEQSFKSVGDEIELHLENECTEAELKAKIDTFMETSGAALVYGGEDAFITQAQANMLIEHIFRKVTGIPTTSIQI